MSVKNLFFLVLLALLATPQIANSDDHLGNTEVLARRGKGIVTQSDFAARADRIPSEVRFQALRDKGRLTDLIANMLLKAQIAADAREAGYDLDLMTSARMKLAAEEELVEAWMQHYVELNSNADYEQLVREYYDLNKKTMTEPEMVDVTHILVSTKEHTEEDAWELVNSLSSQVSENSKLFDQFVLEYSEDPSVETNHGSFKNVKRGDMVGPFEEAAFSLEIGEVSAPVKTKYGYHLIRLDSRLEARQLSFEEVKEQLIAQERKKHEDRVKADYISSLTSLNVEMTEEALIEMVRRQFGEEVLNPEVKTDDSE